MPKILVVDDSVLILKHVRAVLERAGLSVTTHETPFKAFTAMAREQPDLVLLDLDMPGLSGEMLLEVVKQHVAAFSFPIVFHSDRSEVDLAAAVERSGAHGYIRKGADEQHFLEQVRVWLSCESCTA